MSYLIKRRSDLIEMLINRAGFYGYMVACPDRYRVKKLLETNGQWPDDLKPGALILRLPAEQRALLKDVTAQDFNHRVDSILWLQSK